MASTDIPAILQRWPDDQTSRWAETQFNRTLRDDGAIAWSETALRAAGLPLHPDRPKNWDTMLALAAAAGLPRDAAILDAGAESYSSFLPALARMGHTDLTGINLAFESPPAADPVVYRIGDIVAAPFPAATFDFIACLSVIEHGVDVTAFLREAHRLLTGGGMLFVSTDYWETPVPTHGKRAFGVPVRIFDAADIRDIVRVAHDIGLTITGTPTLTCHDRAVHWRQVDLRYTFINLLFRKQ